MNYHELKYILCIAKYQNLTKAAQDLSGILHIFAARKGRCIAVSAAAEQLGPHFSFQFLEMLGQGWLGKRAERSYRK